VEDPLRAALAQYPSGRDCASVIFGYGRHRFRRLCIGFGGRHREKIAQCIEFILDSWTGHEI
jgi:hypothetical protein